MPREVGLMFQPWGVKAIALPPGTPGRKTQTRRLMNPQPHPDFLIRGVCAVVPQWPHQDGVRWFMADGMSELVKSRIRPGDIMYVKETWGICPDYGEVRYRADRGMDERAVGGKWKSSMLMPKRFARLRFPITRVRVQRLQEISKDDATREGFPKDPELPIDPRDWYRNAWESINGPGSWDANPWVWVYEWE